MHLRARSIAILLCVFATGCSETPSSRAGDVGASLDSLTRGDAARADVSRDRAVVPPDVVLADAIIDLATDRSQSPDATSDSASPTQRISDPLTSAAMVAGEASKSERGGKFSARGWQATSGNSRLIIRLAQALSNPGTLTIDVTNFDPQSQSTGSKHQIINLYSQANGSQAIFNTEGAWWNLRTGSGYFGDPMKMKFLSATRGGNSRVETRLKHAVTWDKQRTYTFAVHWDRSGITVKLDGTTVVTHRWGALKERFEYVFLGTDNVYSAQPGPIYSNLRVEAR